MLYRVPSAETFLDASKPPCVVAALTRVLAQGKKIGTKSRTKKSTPVGDAAGATLTRTFSSEARRVPAALCRRPCRHSAILAH